MGKKFSVSIGDMNKYLACSFYSCQGFVQSTFVLFDFFLLHIAEKLMFFFVNFIAIKHIVVAFDRCFTVSDDIG